MFHRNTPFITRLLPLAAFSFGMLLSTAAFQSPPSGMTNTPLNWQRKFLIGPMEERSYSRDMETCLYFERREFLRPAITFAIAGFVSQATVLFDPAVAEAKQGNPSDDIIGGLPNPRPLGGLPKNIRRVGNILDELQRDLMEERWDLVEKYPDQLRSFVPILTKYTDSDFQTNAPKVLRVALRFEIRKFSESLIRLQKTAARRSLDEAFIAYSDMSIHYDQYLHAGGLFPNYDATKLKNEVAVGSYSFVFANLKKNPPLVKDLVIIIKGQDVGRTGILIGIYPNDSGNCVVKLDRFKGLREIKVVPLKAVGKRIGEQDPDDVFLIPRADT